VQQVIAMFALPVIVRKSQHRRQLLRHMPAVFDF